MPKRNNYNTKAILQKIYPKVEEALKKNKLKWKRHLSQFISSRSEMLFDTMPCDRIYYYDKDRDELYSSLGLNRLELNQYLKETYYYNINKFNPSYAKDITSIVDMCVIRYFLLSNDKKDLDLALIYFGFSAKMYPSIHYGLFPTVAPSKYRYVMEYVVNNKLTNKYELKITGSVIGSVKSILLNWINFYSKMYKSFDDEDVVYLIQQAHNRIKSFLKNIAKLYYESYEDKEYITYDKDSLPGEGESGSYHLADNDTFKLQKYVEKTMTKINTLQVEYKDCKACADANVRTEEIKSIIESILNNKSNLSIIREFVTCLIASFMEQSSEKDVASIKFLSYTIKTKPNSKNPLIIRIKEICNKLLEENSIRYTKRKRRESTRLSYEKAVLTYFAIIIINSNK